MAHLHQIDNNIWLYEGETVSFHGFPYPTRMTIVRLANSRLWVHSPSAICPGLLDEVNALGTVQYLISPNKIHHLYMQDWAKHYPAAKLFASPGLADKRADIRFFEELSDQPYKDWAPEIEQLVFKGSLKMEEVVFFHKKSRTLILTDLIENFPKGHFSGVKKILAQWAGIIAPDGKTPLDWRLTFSFGDKTTAKACIKRILKWKPEKVIIAHGMWIEEKGEDFLRRSFRWLL